jgi:hypothetical protein
MVPGGADLSDAEDRGLFISCKGKRHGSRGRMSDMTSSFHQSVSSMSRGEIVD